MPRRKTIPSSNASRPEEKPDSVTPASEVVEPGNSSISASNTSASPASPEPEVQLQPAKFAREGRQTICTVCGTEARLDLDQQLFCPNAHNHPPLTTEAPE
ncbi:MAG: hypothetical protein AAGF93_00210 [Cyanobacteria bacterium P01_H01_bin.105]